MGDTASEQKTDILVSEKTQHNEVDISKADEWKPTRRFYLVFVALLTLTLMVALDGTSISVALPIIASDLHGSALETFWTGTSFLLSSAAMVLPIGSISHIFGRMYTMMGATVLFLVGIIISSVAKDFTVMIVGRTIQGLGGGGIILLLEIIVTDLVPMRRRGAYLGLISAAWAVGSVTGPVIGGSLSYKANWRWIFWLNIPFAAIALVLVPLFLRLKRTPGSLAEKAARVDWLGAVLFVGSITSFLVPVTWGGTQFAWDSASTLAPLLIGAAGLAAFVAYEWHVPGEPMMRIHQFGTYNMWYSLFAALVHNLIVYGGLYFMPLYFEAVRGFDPVLTGVALFPVTFTVAPMSIVAGIVVTKTGSFRPSIWAGWAVTVLGAGIMTLLGPDTTTVQWIFLTLVLGIGLGVLFTSLNFVNMADADDRSMAFAVALFVFFRLLGQAVGVAICGAIFQNQMRNILAASALPQLAAQADEYSRDAQSLVQTIAAMADGADKIALKAAYAEALRAVWATMCGLAGIGLIGSAFIKHRDLDRALNTEQGLIQEEGSKSDGESS